MCTNRRPVTRTRFSLICIAVLCDLGSTLGNAFVSQCFPNLDIRFDAMDRFIPQHTNLEKQSVGSLWLDRFLLNETLSPRSVAEGVEPESEVTTTVSAFSPSRVAHI